MKYRSDIDGLRALAVLSVLIFHINSNWLPGGYTGVDIFFVISGYLISGIILEDLLAERFSFYNFYSKRIRRILPALYFVFFVSLAFGFLIFLPEDFKNLVFSVLYSSIFLANLFFSRESGYFDISSDEKPLLHIWSLSIEEQFYFIWPLFVFVLFFIFSKIYVHKLKSFFSALILVVSLVVVFGFLYGQYFLTTTSEESSAYFLLRTRFSELVMGALFAFLPACRIRWVCRVSRAAGLLLIASGLLLLDKQSLFPGFNALLPCLGAALFIYAGRFETDRGDVLGRMFEARWLVGIGLISYSLYLWHWPVLAYLRYIYGSYVLPLGWLAVAVPAMFAFAYLSYRHIELRFKRMRTGFLTSFVGVFLLPALVLAALGTGLRAVKPDLDLDPELVSYGTDVCHGTFDKRCVRGATDERPRVLMTGDSHAAALNSFIDVTGRHEGWGAYVVTASSCSPVFDLNENVLPESSREPCRQLKKVVAEDYRQYQAVLFASFWSYQLGMEPERADPEYLLKLERMLREIALTTPVYVFSDVPELPVSPIRLEHFERLGLSIARPSGSKTELANATIKRLVDSIPNVHWVDLQPVIHQLSQQGLFQRRMVYFDNNHLNIYGARSLGQLFVRDGYRVLPP